MVRVFGWLFLEGDAEMQCGEQRLVWKALGVHICVKTTREAGKAEGEVELSQDQ